MRRGGGPISKDAHWKGADAKSVPEGTAGTAGSTGGGQDAASRARRSMRSRLAMSGARGNGRGPQKSDGMAIIHYVEGEPLKNLKKYLGTNAEEGQAVEVHIPPGAMTRSNRQVRARQLWGTNVYTDDSDIVAVLMHTGYYSNSAASPPSTVKEFVAIIRPVQARGGFASESRYNIRSRAWGGVGSGCGFRVESCSITTKSGNFIHLEPCTSIMPSAIPTFIPAATERVVNTRSSAASLERKQRFVQEVTVQYNLCNEPWLKYNMATIADRGLKRHQWTSSRLKKEVLYLESTSTRYELCWAHSVMESGAEQDFYRWSKCKRPLALKLLRQKGIPLPEDEVEQTIDDIDWEELKWAPSGVEVKNQKFQIARVQFLQRTCLAENEGNSI